MSDIEHWAEAQRERNARALDAEFHESEVAALRRDVAKWQEKAGAARRDLRGAVDALATYGRHHDYCRSQRVLGQGPCNCGYEAVRSAVFGGQYEQPATKDTTAVEALKRIRDHANGADDPAMIAQQALNQLGER